MAKFHYDEKMGSFFNIESATEIKKKPYDDAPKKFYYECWSGETYLGKIHHYEVDVLDDDSYQLLSIPKGLCLLEAYESEKDKWEIDEHILLGIKYQNKNIVPIILDQDADINFHINWAWLKPDGKVFSNGATWLNKEKWLEDVILTDKEKEKRNAS